MALLPFGPIHIVAISALPVSERVGVAGRLRCLVLRLHRRRGRRLLYRGHGRARRLTVRAAATVMPCLIRVIYSIAVLGPVYNSHIMVAHPRHVLAVFIIPCAAAVLHLAAVLSRGGGAAAATLLGSSARGWAWLVLGWAAPGRFCACGELRGVDARSAGGRMRLRRRPYGARRPVVSRAKIELASRDILASKYLLPMDAVA